MVTKQNNKKRKKINFDKFKIENYKELEIKEINLDEVQNYVNENIIGCDESGVGDYFSPLVSAAVFIEKDNIEKVKKLGIDDSKKFDDKKIKVLFEQLKPLIKFRVNHLSQQGYNNLNKYLNAHELKMFLHLKSITQLEILDKIDEKYIVIDQFASSDNIKNYYDKLMKSQLKTDQINKEIILITKGESYFIQVAAASIVARYYLITKMEEQNEACEMEFPLGAGNNVDEFGVNFVRKFGRKALFEVSKISFKNTKKIDEMIEKEQK